MAKRYGTAVRETIEQLAATGLKAGEIRERLNDGSAGLPEPVSISYRRVHEIVRAYEAKHGPPETLDPTPDSIARLKHRIATRFREEIAEAEQRKPGRLTTDDVRKLRAVFGALDEFERRTEGRQKQKAARRPRSKAAARGNGVESAIAQLAKEQTTGNPAPTTGPLSPDTTSPETTKDRERSEDEAASAADVESDEGQNGLEKGGPSSAKARVIRLARANQGGTAPGTADQHVSPGHSDASSDAAA